LKCPKGHGDLKPATRHRLPVSVCPTCGGMWFEYPELDQLENEVFDFGEHAKGTLVVDSTPTTDECPECDTLMDRFRYRFYDLQMEVCRNAHGYWLERGEDDRVLELMKTEERDLKRKLSAEDKWAGMLSHMRSRSFFDRLRDLFRR
jgi:Zn-finger nucleic acid-binding protein